MNDIIITDQINQAFRVFEKDNIMIESSFQSVSDEEFLFFYSFFEHDINVDQSECHFNQSECDFNNSEFEADESEFDTK